MALVDRVKNILISPKSEWDVIAGETSATADLIKGYVAPLATIPAVCGFIGGSLIGYSGFGISYRTPMVTGLTMAVLGFVMSIVSVFIVSFIVNALAPTFAAEKSDAQAMKVTVYSFTATWIGGVFSMIPGLRMLGVLAALYGIFLMYLGLPKLMKCPEDKAIGYTAVVIIAAIVVSVILSVIVGAVGGLGMGAAGMFGGMERPSRSAKVEIDPNSSLGKLEAFGKQMEDAGKKMEAAQKSGNQDEAAKAAMNVLGTALGGGKNVDPLDIEKLKPFVPETFAGLAKKSSKAEKAGALGIMVSKAEARYADDAGGKRVDLEVSDVGGAGGMLAFAGWAMVQGEQQDQYGSEKTGKVDGRLVHEKVRKDGRNEYDIVLGERFVVSAKGEGVDINTLKSAVAGLDLGKLESMKNEGVKQ